MKEYFVTIHNKISENTGEAVIAETWRNEAGQLDRVNGPAIIETEVKTNHIWLEHWYSNGQLHRDGGPAILETPGLPGDRSKREEWYTNGKLNRVDGPASLRQCSEGVIYLEEWAIDGMLHCPIPDKPAYILRDAGSGVLIEEVYMKNGELHRDNGLPAKIERDSNTGIAFTEIYAVSGKIYRIIDRDTDTGVVLSDDVISETGPSLER